MSLINASQLKIPFQAVVHFLQALEPGSSVAPEEWASAQVQDIAPGDVLFIWEILYSPWGDSSSGLGVSDGDSFRLAQLFLAHNVENGALSGFLVGGDTFEKRSLSDYFSQAARAARQNGVGYYFSIIRPRQALSPDALNGLAALENYGSSGWRADDNNRADLPFAFFHAAGYGSQAQPGVLLDVTALGYALFCDKEPPPGLQLPDLRPYTTPVSRDSRLKLQPSAAALSADSAPAASTPPKTGIPKLPSFLNMMGGKKGAGAQRQSSPHLDVGNLFGDEPEASPAAPDAPPPAAAALSPWDEAPIDDPAETVQLAPDAGLPFPLTMPETPEVAEPAPSANSSVPQPPAPPTHVQPPRLPGAPPPVPTIKPVTPPAAAASSAPALSLPDVGVPSPESTAITEIISDNPTPQPEVLAAPPSLSLPSMPVAPPAVAAPGALKVPPAPVAPGLPGAPKVPGVPSVPAAPPMPVVPGAPNLSAPTLPDVPAVEAPVEPPVASTPPALELPDVPAPAAPAPAAEAAPPAPAVEAPAAKAAPAAPAPVDRPYLNEPAAPTVSEREAGVDSIMAAIENSIRQSSPPQGRTRPGRAPKNAEPPAAAPPQVELPQELPQVVEPEASEPAVGETTEELEAVTTEAETAPDTAKDAQKLASLKEPIAVKSGVAGLVSKLEQQASRASARLETQVDEIQNRLSEDLARLVNKAGDAEKRAGKNAETLRQNLAARLDSVTTAVIDEVARASTDGKHSIGTHKQSGGSQLTDRHQQVQSSLKELFENVRAEARVIRETFEEQMQAHCVDALAGLDSSRERYGERFSELEQRYEQVLRDALDAFKERVASLSVAVGDAMEKRNVVLEEQLNDLRRRQLTTCEHNKAMLLSRLVKKIEAGERELDRLRSEALATTIRPKLKQHREELYAITAEFQLKLTEELESKGAEKINQLGPLLEQKREKLSHVLKETGEIKDRLQGQLEERLQSILSSLSSFIDQSLEQAESSFHEVEERLVEIDKQIRTLADPSGIEGDMDLLGERQSALGRMDEVTEKSKEEVLSTLRSSVAGLEEKSKHLQEELISAMEEDAYQVRRASEQSLVSIREAIRDAFVAIQTAQDERMPM